MGKIRGRRARTRPQRKGVLVSEGSIVDSYDAAGFVEFLAAGEPAAGAYHCSECGYGIVVQRVLPPCPMCRGDAWEESASRPFTAERQLH